MRISDWSSDVCSSDLAPATERAEMRVLGAAARRAVRPHRQFTLLQRKGPARQDKGHAEGAAGLLLAVAAVTSTECSDLLRVYAVANRPALTAAEPSHRLSAPCLRMLAAHLAVWGDRKSTRLNSSH